MKLITKAIINWAVRGGRASSAMKSSIRPRFACANRAIRSQDIAGVAQNEERTLP
jgi:hypothetical protein